jgi:hypothetical protein
MQNGKNIIDSFFVVKSTSSQRIPDSNRNVMVVARLPRHPQDAGYKRSNPVALPLATTVKREFVAHATSLSRSEQLARAASAADGSAAAEKEGATGEPDGCRHTNNELICS